MLAFKAGKPDWALFDEPTIADLLAVPWKLINIQKLAQNGEEYKQQQAKLWAVLNAWIQ